MSRTLQTANKREKDESDWNSYQVFLRLWKIGTLTEDDEIYRKVENASSKICRSYERPERMMDVCHTCLVALAKGQYKKGCSLNTYLAGILKTEIISMWSLADEVNADAVVESRIRERSSRVIEEVFRRLSSEKHMKSLMASRPDLRRNIVELIIASDCYGIPLQNKLIQTLKPQSYKKPRNPYIRSIGKALKTNGIDRITRFFKFIHESHRVAA